MCEPKNSRFKLPHSQQTSKPSALHDRSSLSSQNLPLKTANLPQSSHDKFYSPPCGKENMSSPTSFPKGTKSEKVKVALQMDQNTTTNDKNIKGKQRSEKNYRDLNKSLANLVRVPGSSSSGEDALGIPSKDFSGTANLGPKFEESKTQSFSNTMNSKDIPIKRGQAKTPQISTFKEQQQSVTLYTVHSPETRKESHPIKKEKYQQGRGGGVSIATFNKQDKKSGGQGVGYSYYKGVYNGQRQLLTEPDAPRGDFLGERLSPDLMKRVEKKFGKGKEEGKWKMATASMQGERMTMNTQEGRVHTQSSSSQKMGPKLFGSGSKKIGEMEQFYEKQSVENPEMLNFNNISDGVSYGIGGVGFHAGGRRERVQEGDSMDASIEYRMQEEIARSRQSLEAGPSIQSTTSTQNDPRLAQKRVSHWKCELLEIRKDIERRKQSYEKVNKFFTICDENGSFVANQEDVSESVITLPPAPKYSSHHASQQQSQGGGAANTLQTLQTLPSQYGDRVVSPSFSSFNNPINSKLPYKNRGSKLFVDVRAIETEGNEEMRPSRASRVSQDQVAQENGSRLKTVSHYEYATLETHGDAELNGTFDENPLDKRPPKPSCCGTGSGCQIF